MVDFSLLTPLFNSGLITLGVAFVAYNQYRTSQTNTSVSTAQILRDNISAKDTEIAQMKTDHDTAIANMKTLHDSAIAELKSQITALSVQIEELRKSNAVLQNTVNGRDLLGTIVEVLKPIPLLFVPGGFIEQVTENQQKTLKDLAEIRDAMEKATAVPSPVNKPFQHRGDKKSLNTSQS